MPSVLDLKGMQSTNLPATPAAGAQWTTTLDLNYTYEIICIHFQLATAVAVANRYPAIRIHLAPALDVDLAFIAAITASLTVQVNLWAGIATPPVYTANYFSGSLPSPLILKGGTSITSAVIQLQAADELTDVQILARTWANPHTA